MKYTALNDIPLLDSLAILSPKSSKNTLKGWIDEGRVSIDGVVADKTQKTLKKGETVTIGNKVLFLPGDLKILYQDEHLVAINKPEGLLSVATDYEKGDTAHGILKRHFKGAHVHVVHRLDQETSGVMLFALSEIGRDMLKDLFEKHDLYREYIAIVDGHLDPKEGEWRSYLTEDAVYKVHSSQDPTKGQLAITHYTVEGASKRFSRLRLVLETGKKNQIRVHCQEAKVPVMGDKKYGSKVNPIGRLALHAHRLELIHPITGKKLAFHVPPPSEFLKIVPIRKKKVKE